MEGQVNSMMWKSGVKIHILIYHGENIIIIISDFHIYKMITKINVIVMSTISKETIFILIMVGLNVSQLGMVI